jgi:hypothetical protein
MFSIVYVSDCAKFIYMTLDSLHWLQSLTSHTTMPKMKRKKAHRKTTKLVARTRLLSMGLSNLYQGVVKIGSQGRNGGFGGSGNLPREVLQILIAELYIS